MTTANSTLFTGASTPSTVAFHPLVALASFIFALNLRQSSVTDSADQADAAVTWGL